MTTMQEQDIIIDYSDTEDVPIRTGAVTFTGTGKIFVDTLLGRKVYSEVPAIPSSDDDYIMSVKDKVAKWLSFPGVTTTYATLINTHNKDTEAHAALFTALQDQVDEHIADDNVHKANWIGTQVQYDALNPKPVDGTIVMIREA
jgi:hypothetical protein